MSRSAPCGRPSRAALLGLLALSLVGAPGRAFAGLRETFEAANVAFWSGEYARSAAAYEELISLGVRDPDVYYNLGTAYARLDRPGLAILNLERALRRAPGHQDARHNLAAARRALARERSRGGEDADLDPPRTFWMNLLGRATPASLSIPFLICWVGLFIVLALRRIARGEVVRLVLLVVAPVLTVLVLALGGLLASKDYFDTRVQEAVVVAPDRASLREGPGGSFDVAVTLREGDTVRVIDEERAWIHVRDARGHEGWGARADFGLLRL